MPAYSLSTKKKRPQDDELIKRAQTWCDEHGMTFSGLVLKLLKEHDDGRHQSQSTSKA